MDALVGCLLLDVVNFHIIVVSNVVVVVIVGVIVIVFKCFHEDILNSSSYHVIMFNSTYNKHVFIARTSIFISIF